MTFALVVIGLLILGVIAVVWATRKKPAETRTGPREGDTAWNDPISGVEPTAPPARADGLADAPRTPTDPRP